LVRALAAKARAHAHAHARTAGLGGGGAAGASAGWSEQKKPWRQRTHAARPATSARAAASGIGSGVGAAVRALGLAAGFTGFSCVCTPTAQPGSDMKSPKSWLRAWQQLHSFVPSWKTGAPG
jgi:hypothetical protein